MAAVSAQSMRDFRWQKNLVCIKLVDSFKNKFDADQGIVV